MTASLHHALSHSSSTCEEKVEIDESSSRSEAALELRPDAPAFVPQDFKLPPKLKTSRKEVKKNDVYKVLDAVPFTPSQGVRTPSPNNMASLRWQLYSPFTRYTPDSPRAIMCNYGAPSDSSSSDASATQPASPMQPVHASLFSPFVYCPVNFSSGPASYGHIDPASPLAHNSPLVPGSPVSTPRGAPFPAFGAAPFTATHFAPFGPVYSVPTVPPSADCLPQSHQFMFSEPNYKPAYPPYPPPFAVSGQFTSAVPDRPPAQYAPFPPQGPDIATTFQTAAQQLQPMLHCAASLPHPGSRYVRHRSRMARSMELPDDFDSESNLKTKFKQRKSNSEPRVGTDGHPRLNARQRRTLRRAKERALKALTETSHKMLAKAGVPTMLDDPGTPVSSHSNSTAATATHTSPSRSTDSDSGEGSNFGDKDDGKYEDIDSLDISDLIQQLQVRADEGLVDEKLVRDLQIIQGLLGALKQPVPITKPPSLKSRLSRLTIGSDTSGSLSHSPSPSPTPA